MLSPTPTSNPVVGFLSAAVHVIPGEDPAEFDSLVLEYRRVFAPDGPVEVFFFQTMVLCDWKKRRLTRIEARVLALVKPFSDSKESSALKILSRDLRYQDRLYFQSFRELRKLQQERHKAAPAEAQPQAVKPQPVAKVAAANAAPQSPQTGGIGFVSPKTDAPSTIPHYDLTGRTYKPGLVFVG